MTTDGEDEEANGPGRDLVIVSLPSVQRFIAESRTTSDVSSASSIYSAIAERVLRSFDDAQGELVLPAMAPGRRDQQANAVGASSGMPNRVVALFPPHKGEAATRRAVADVDKAWQGWIRAAFGLSGAQQLPETPGFPAVQWVCVGPLPGGYREQWIEAHRLLAARKRVHDFEWAEWRRSALCSASPRWPAADPPAGLKEHEKAALSTTGWVKRRWRKTVQGLGGFPSTSSIASAPFRDQVLKRLDDEDVLASVRNLARAAQAVIRQTQGGDVRETRIAGLLSPLPDPQDWFASTAGPWVYLERWQADSLARESKVDPASIRADVEAGRRAAARLHTVMRERYREPEPAAYLAVIVQDVDNMGRFLGGLARSINQKKLTVSAPEHRRVSGLLQGVAGNQRDLLGADRILGVPVYAGGDDLLAFVPARNALEAVKQCHKAIPPDLPTASTAVMFFHYHAGLQGVLSRARDLLDEAKKRVDDKHALAVGYIRRSGVSEASIQQWTADGGQAADLFAVFAADAEHRLSPRLLADLERDKEELAALSAAHADVFRAELARLVRRHTLGAKGGILTAAAAQASAVKAANALDWLGSREQAGTSRPDDVARLEIAARVGVFLRQEAR
jgi:CRISPR-associated protein Cmr2